MLLNCRTCIKEHQNPKEPLMLSQFLDQPWQKLGPDLFMLGSKPYLLVVDYYSRVTPLQNGYTPAQLLMGIRLRTTVPMLSALLNIALPDAKTIARKENERRIRDTKHFNMCHRARDLTKLLPGEEVWVTDDEAPGAVVPTHFSLRSYLVNTGPE
ncbi:hypothetical protein SRHO_G00078510 [Serrasalmus rhombeus]